MDKAELERITNGLAQGEGETTITDSDGNDRSYNVIGAVNEMMTVLEDMEKYGLAFSDLTQEQQEALDLGQQALQYHEAKLGRLLESFVENDGSITLSDGTVVDLPNGATTADTDGFPQSLPGTDVTL